jgi:cytidylate kinase
VIDGRDIGSVVFKNANLKLYIDVSEKNRAKRRYKQLIDNGEKSIYPQILKDIKLRDKKDKARKNSPLVIPKGAFIIDNNSSFRNTSLQINKLIKKI